MRKEDIIAFAHRDWASVAEVKERYWAKRKSSMTPGEALRLGDALRADGEALRGRPTSEERTEDLAAHVRVAEMLRRAGSRRRR